MWLVGFFIPVKIGGKRHLPLKLPVYAFSACSERELGYSVQSMKAPFLNRKSAGFTLIELLVVIAIILTLAGVSMVVINGVQERSHRMTAKKECTDLERGIETYMQDYGGRLPLDWTKEEQAKHSKKDGQFYVTTAVDDESRILNILTCNLANEAEERRLNKKKITYFTATQTEVEGTSGLYLGGRGVAGLMDPWQNPYYIVLNAQPNPDSPRLYLGKRMLTKNVAVYSVGKDKEGSIEDGKFDEVEVTEDNVTSW